MINIPSPISPPTPPIYNAPVSFVIDREPLDSHLPVDKPPPGIVSGGIWDTHKVFGYKSILSCCICPLDVEKIYIVNGVRYNKDGTKSIFQDTEGGRIGLFLVSVDEYV